MDYLINVTVNETRCTAEYVGQTPLTSGGRGELVASFDFDESWNEMEITAVFYAGSVEKAVILDDSNRCTVPDEVQIFPFVILKVGVIGVPPSGLERHSVIAPVTGLEQGAYLPKGPGNTITPNLYAQLLALIHQVEVSGVSDEHLKDLILKCFPEVMNGGDANSVNGAVVDDGKMSTHNLWTSAQIANFVRKHIGGNTGHICNATHAFAAGSVERRRTWRKV